MAFREEDIRPAAIMAAKKQCIEADRGFLLSQRSLWVHVACPACHSEDAVGYGEKRGFRYDLCRKCGTVYTNPRPSASLLHEFYQHSQNYSFWNQHVFPATEAVRREQIFRPRVDRLLDCCRTFAVHTGTLLEIGAGFGTFCEELRARDAFEHVVAVEPTPDLAATCRDRGLEVLEVPVEDLQEDGLANVVVAFELVEHLFSPCDFLGICRRLLRRDGLLVLTCPNIRGFDVAALGVQSNTFDHEHLNYFHPQSLAATIEASGLHVLETKTPGHLDAELVRKGVLAGTLSLEGQPLLKEILLERWEELAGPFQAFLAANRLSSHMWIAAQNRA